MKTITSEDLIRVRLIKQKVAEASGFSVHQLLGRRRPAPLVEARHAAIYLARTCTQLSTTEIGRRFNRDHSMVLQVVAQVEGLKHHRDGRMMWGLIHRVREDLPSMEMCDVPSEALLELRRLVTEALESRVPYHEDQAAMREAALRLMREKLLKIQEQLEVIL